MDKKIADWMRDNDIFVKLHAAIDLVRNSGGDAVFEGLQTGKAMVEITYDGEYIHFALHPQDTEPELPAVQGQIQDVSEGIVTPEEKPAEESTDETEPEPVKKKRSRYTA